MQQAKWPMVRLYLLRGARISHAFVDEAFARGDYRSFVPQSCQRNGDFLLVAAAHSVCDNVDLVSGLEEIDGGLCDADVAFDANDDARERAGDFEAVESGLDFGCSNMI
jgi:hypothetical protein